MILLLSYLTIVFLFLAFLAHPSSYHNVLGSYYASLLDFFLNNIVLSLIGFLIAVALFLRSFHIRMLVKKPFLFFFQLIGSILVSSFFSLIILLGIAFLQLNSLVIAIDINPQIVGVTTDRNTLVKTLTQAITPPDIIATSDSKEREVVGIAQNSTGVTSMYGRNLLGGIPNLFILPIEQPLSSMILADNTLIITKINADDLQAVAPTLAYGYIRHYFPLRTIKATPTISIMNTQQYVKHREDNADERVVQLTSEIDLVNEKISSLSAGIQHDEDQLSYFQGLASDSAQILSDQYKKCINAGEYHGNTYVHYYSESYCKTQQDNLSTSADSHAKDVTDWTNVLAYDKEQLTAYKSYVDFFTAEETITQVGKTSLPDELGVFEPPQSIRIALQTSNSHAIADYIETLIHEYLHYASFVDGKKLTSTFFEEGLTEYFARQATQDSLQINTNVGYPLQVKIIAAMTKRIDESELADIYFSKDESHLESTLNRVYGDNFYQTYYSVFQALMYTTDSQKELQFANSIMSAIGGQQLKESDLESTYSSL